MLCKQYKVLGIFVQYPVLFFFFLFSCSDFKKNKDYSLISSDTVVLPYSSVQFARSLYMPEYEAQVNTYFTQENGQLKFVFCTASLLPERVFHLKSSLSMFLPENKETLLVRYPYEQNKSFLLRIDTMGEILDTVWLRVAEGYKREFSFRMFGEVFSWPEKGNKRHYYIPIIPSGSYNYVTNMEDRKRMFSGGVLSELKISQNEIQYVKEIGHYPHFILSDKPYYNPHPSIAMSKNGHFVSCYQFLDSLFVTFPDGSQTSYFIQSRNKSFSAPSFDPKKAMDYNYITKYAFEHQEFINLLYDSYQNHYYVISTKPGIYENRDGTLNDFSDLEWSLIIVDSNFRQITEIDMPATLDKYGILITEQGIAIIDKMLSAKHPQKKLVYVIYNLYEQ